MNFDVPNPTRDVGPDGMFDRAWIAFVSAVKAGVVRRSQAGTTAQRPASGDGLEVGLPFYDTTLGKPIFVHQVKPTVIWHDASGAVV